MPRSFDEIVAGTQAAVTPSAPAPVTPGDPPPVPAAPRDIGRGEGGPGPAAGDGRMGTGPVRADGGSAAEAPHPPLPDDKVMHPVTGEVLELAEVSADRLAGYVATLGTFIADMTGWKRLAEDELRRRLGKDKLRVWGDWEVAAVSGRGRKWDTEDLRAAVGGLIADGVLTHQDVADLIVAGEPSVNGTAAARLLDRVAEEHRPALEACFTWERKGRASVRVTRSVDLTP